MCNAMLAATRTAGTDTKDNHTKDNHTHCLTRTAHHKQGYTNRDKKHQQDLNQEKKKDLPPSRGIPDANAAIGSPCHHR
jgi:hypothetical protein